MPITQDRIELLYWIKREAEELNLAFDMADCIKDPNERLAVKAGLLGEMQMLNRISKIV